MRLIALVTNLFLLAGASAWAQAKMPIPPAPPGTYKSFNELYAVVPGAGGGFSPNGTNGGQPCENNPACRAPAGTMVPPSGYLFCSASVWPPAHIATGSFFGYANADGTMSYNTYVGSLGIRMNMILQFIKIGYVGLNTCIQGRAWECGAGTAGGPNGCKVYKNPIVIK
jgi:hypothetical protein